MTDLYDAAVALVVAGFSVGLTMFWLRYLSRQHRRRMDQLLGLREALLDDLLGTLVLQQKTLADLGLRSLDWRGSWYGSPVFTRLGAKIPTNVHEASPLLAFDSEQLNDRVIQRIFDYDDISLKFRIGLKGVRGERHLFAVQAAEVLFAMIQGALAARQLALVAASSQRAKVGVFLQHDMRNMAQWVQLVADDFGSAENDAELLVRAKRLRKNAALATNRAERMTRALLNPAWQPSASAPLMDHQAPDLSWLDLAEHIAQAAELHQIDIDLAGTAQVQWDGHALGAVLDNVLGNVSSLSRERMLKAHCRIVVRQLPEHTLVDFETPQLPLEIPLEKLFEPWSSSGPANKGLGMYQARKQTQAAGGEIFAEKLDKGLRVTLSIPL